MNLYVRGFLSGLMTGSVAYAVVWMYRKLKKREKIRNDCIFFSPLSITSKSSIKNCSCNHLSCSFCNYNKFVSEILKAKTHLDICVYLITMEDLHRVVLKLFKNGVFVRVITDKQMSDEASNAKVVFFLKEHIPLKLIKSSEIMHNKFVIIDKRKLIMGSFNWTKQAVTKNFETGVILHDHEIVNKFSDYFQDLWNSYD